MNNNDEIYLNGVVMEEERMEEEFEIQPSLQIKENINVDERKETIKRIFFKNCIFKEESGDMIVEMQYVGHFMD